LAVAVLAPVAAPVVAAVQPVGAVLERQQEPAEVLGAGEVAAQIPVAEQEREARVAPAAVERNRTLVQAIQP